MGSNNSVWVGVLNNILATKNNVNSVLKVISVIGGILICALMLWVTSDRISYGKSATCRSLQAQLSQIETGRGAKPSKRYLQYDRAVTAQQKQIKKTERAAGRNNCQFWRSNTCNRINASLSKMYGNLSQLKQIRASLAPKTGNRNDRARIIGAMEHHNCGTAARQQAKISPTAPRRRTLLEQIFGTKTYSNNSANQDYNPNLDSRYGTYRTLCVRTCDGYYFPISFSTNQSRFESDATQCHQMCPGSETALYFHPMPSGDAETSISLRTGEPYADLPNAFSYRKSVKPECSCRSSVSKNNFSEIAGVEQVTPKTVSKPGPRYPIPKFRVDSALDIGSADNQAGGLTLDVMQSLANGEINDVIAKNNGQIRIVGPAFFPVQ